MADVSSDLVEARPVTVGADTFLGLFDASELENRQAARFLRRNSVAPLVGRGHADVGLEFVVQALLGPVPIEKPAQDRCEPMQKCHAPSKTLVIAKAIRSQRCRCRSSCFRPDGVSR